MMEIRKYRAADREELIELWTHVFPNDPKHNKPELMIDAKLAIDDLIFVVEKHQQLVAACMAGYDGHRGWLYAVAVLPAYRRAGVGRRLVLFAMENLNSLGCIKVNLQIRADNHKVSAFYQSLGFRVEDRLSLGKHIP